MTESGTADLETRHRAMWALGDYPAVATEVVPGLGRHLVEVCGIGPGRRVLDIAAGSGNAAIPAAETGAHVVASDLTPEMFDGADVSPPPGASICSGRTPTPRHCPTPMPSSTP